MTRRIGFVGLGTMGAAVSGRLLASGYEVFGTVSKAVPLIAAGMRWCQTPAGVARASDVVFSMVTDGDALEAVVGGRDGILAGTRPGQVLIDMSTVRPATSTDVANRFRQAGAAMLDAPVSGSVREAASGTLAMMVGGDRATFARVEGILQALANPIRHVGENGRGVVLKLAVNISLGMQMLALAEGLELATQASRGRSPSMS